MGDRRMRASPTPTSSPTLLKVIFGVDGGPERSHSHRLGRLDPHSCLLSTRGGRVVGSSGSGGGGGRGCSVDFCGGCCYGCCNCRSSSSVGSLSASSSSPLASFAGRASPRFHVQSSHLPIGETPHDGAEGAATAGGACAEDVWVVGVVAATDDAVFALRRAAGRAGRAGIYRLNSLEGCK
jgi:hypothetical protein